MIRGALVFATVCGVLAGDLRADTPTPAQRAQASIDAQLGAFKLGLAGEKVFLALFDSKGIIVGDGAVMTAAELTSGLADAYDKHATSIGSNAPHHVLPTLFGALPDGTTDRAIKSATLGKVTAGGTADAVWFSFDLTETMWVKKRFRISELLVRQGEAWKLVVAHIGTPRIDDWEDEEESEGGGPQPWGDFPQGDAQPGPLAQLAVTPKELSRALPKDPVPAVLGTSDKDVAIGNAAATKTLAGWAKLKLELESSVEQRTSTWGYAVVQVKLPGKPGAHGARSMKMRATVFAIPKPKGGWQVVAAQYSRVDWK